MRDSKLDAARKEYRKRLNRYLLKSILFIIFVLAPFGFVLDYLNWYKLIDSSFYGSEMIGLDYNMHYIYYRHHF